MKHANTKAKPLLQLHAINYSNSLIKWVINLLV